METIVLKVEPRECKKKEAAKLLNAGRVPAVVYHKGEETLHVSVENLALEKLIHSAESHIIDLHFPDGKSKRSFIKDVQFDPLTDKAIHADFQFFSAGEVLEMEVPTSFTGEARGVVEGGKMQIIQHSLTVKGIPSNIPEHITIDVSSLELGQTMHIREIPTESHEGKFEITGEPDTPVVSILAPRKAEEPTAEETEEEETPAE
ncbi:50S ribosomal protein L25/general stress protein Ctc [Prosthecochloris sp. GSB1]|uniref:50S ribosomal protein L25/general stress protein Ctc n=1 Tax=Prosthecochloris sp. GSB1 TaxID=281093 RepID=UPI000B8CE311|nr:50S ribosomal protein L25/general stress protein Ctc [Prosthecochloris sp. GSB1]ASQ90194.1 50S ribosomal protein L25/general stress protein Ctc [Prosthecochloris sp. GSB1]